MYVHYGKIWCPVVLAFTLCAVVVYRRRQPRGFEAWAWRGAIAVFTAVTVGVLLSYWTQWTGHYDADGIEQALFTAGTWIDFLGLGLMLPVVTVLGVTLLLKRFRPVLPSVLLALFVPLALGITEVTSLGSALLPVMFAFGILGRRIAKAPIETAPIEKTESSPGTRREFPGDVGVGSPRVRAPVAEPAPSDWSRRPSRVERNASPAP